eukprot:scaffold24872_cov43-Phaeocystis_antarctica.AAC.2
MARAITLPPASPPPPPPPPPPPQYPCLHTTRPRALRGGKLTWPWPPPPPSVSPQCPSAPPLLSRCA